MSAHLMLTKGLSSVVAADGSPSAGERTMGRIGRLRRQLRALSKYGE
jgi:hypothetical protein